MLKDESLLIFAGAGFSKSYGFPDMRELWDLALTREVHDGYQADIENIKTKYPLAYFIENDIHDIELLLSIWDLHLQNYYEHFPNADMQEKGYFEDYIVNFCLALETKEGKLSEQEDFSLLSHLFRSLFIEQKIIFWTVNYDRVIEHLIVSAGGNYCYHGQLCENVPLRKPHGSINWLVSPPGIERKDDRWRPPLLFEINSEEAILDFRLERIPFIAAKRYPAIIPPIVSKKYEGIFSNIITDMSQDKNYLKNMLIIGYSFRPSDIMINAVIRDAAWTILRKGGKIININKEPKNRVAFSNCLRQMESNKIINMAEPFNSTLFERVINAY